MSQDPAPLCRPFERSFPRGTACGRKSISSRLERPFRRVVVVVDGRREHRTSRSSRPVAFEASAPGEATPFSAVTSASSAARGATSRRSRRRRRLEVHTAAAGTLNAVDTD